MKIGIVEDEIIIADSISKTLKEIGYTVTEPAISYAEAVEMLQEEKPDLVLLDIQLRGKKDGIEVARFIRENYTIPFIFLTANADTATVARAKEVAPPAYLMKPFNRDDLYTSIEICLNNVSQKVIQTPETKKYLVNDALFIKEGAYFHKVKFNDILYISSDHVYVTVVTPSKKFLVRSSLQQYLESFSPQQFFRVHRGFAVNLGKVDKINNEYLVVDGHQIPVSKTYREDLLSVLRLS